MHTNSHTLDRRWGLSSFYHLLFAICLLPFEFPLVGLPSIPSCSLSASSNVSISPSSVAWSYPWRCKAPCRISQRISFQEGCPAAAAFRRAASVEITISPRKPANPSPQPPSWPFPRDATLGWDNPVSCQGNESTSVGFPRNSSFNRRIALSSTKQTLNHCPLSRSAALSLRTKARASAARTVTLVCRFLITQSGIQGLELSLAVGSWARAVPASALAFSCSSYARMMRCTRLCRTTSRSLK